MKGLLIYEQKEIERNRSFIDRLIKAANNLGHSLTVLDDQNPIIPEADFIFFRSRNPKLSKELERRNIPMFNRAEVNVIANDKWRAIQFAQLLGIPAVPTKKIATVSEIDAFPVVLKTVDGHGGTQVELCHSPNHANTFLQEHASKTIIAQTYIEANATDVRVFMLGTKVIGAVKRIGAANSFKSNFTLGGTVEKYELNNEQLAHVQKIAKALKSDYIGIDFLLPSSNNWVFNEIEDPVGARSYFATTGQDIAIPIMQHIHKKLTEKECTD